jgi:hypothetical protein
VVELKKRLNPAGTRLHHNVAGARLFALWPAVRVGFADKRKAHTQSQKSIQIWRVYIAKKPTAILANKYNGNYLSD